MKILIADDSKSIRIKLAFALEKMGYEVLQTSRGLEALEWLLESHGPEIAILDWMMDDIEGVQICRELRAAFKEKAGRVVVPYLILMTAKSGVDEIAAGLDSGADDYLVKPWNDKVLGARIRVAVRTLELQKELNKQIEAMASMIRRYQMRQQAMSKLHISVPPPFTVNAENGENVGIPSATRFSEKLSKIPAVVNMTRTIARAFSRIGCGRASAIRIMDAPPVTENDDIVIWTTMISRTGGACLDLRVEMKAQVARKLFRTTMKSDPANQMALWDAMSEMLDIVQEDIKAEMTDGGVELITPIQPKVLLVKSLRMASIPLTPTDRFLVDISGNRVALYVSEYNSPILSKKLAEVKVNDILMGPIDIGREEQQRWFVEGMALGPAALKKLMDTAGDQEVGIRVVEPTSLGRLALSL